MTDVSDGEGAMNIKCVGNYTAKLVVRDGAGIPVELRSWHFMVLPKDTSVPSYGPNGRGCANGNAVDGEAMDSSFTCKCNTNYLGSNCDEATDQTMSTNVSLGVGLGLFGALLVVLGVYKLNS